MIQMKLCYTTIFEYIMIRCTPIGSEGHSGRHAVGFWDTVLDGEMWYYGGGSPATRICGSRGDASGPPVPRELLGR
jgi:C-8 sterol isomerase